jgi:hypothetical protein
MDLGTWISVIALALVIPLGVATNLLTPKVVSYLERRRILKTHRTKAQELAAHARAKSFKDGRSDKYAYFLLAAGLANVCVVTASTIVIVYFLKFEVVVLVPSPILVLAAAFYVCGLFLLALIAGLSRRIDRFKEYEDEIRKKWGDDAI